VGSSPVDAEQTRLAGLQQYGPQLQSFLAPGETLSAVVSACLDSDIKDPPRKFQPRPSRLLGHLGGALERVAPVLAPSETVLTGILNIASGKTWGGGWNSQAGQLIIAAYPVKHVPGGGLLGTSLQFAVTDRRILVVYLPRRASKVPAGVIAEYGPGQLRNRPEPPPRRQKHRADLVFPDGSWIALQADSPQQADLLRHIFSAAA